MAAAFTSAPKLPSPSSKESGLLATHALYQSDKLITTKVRRLVCFREKGPDVAVHRSGVLATQAKN